MKAQELVTCLLDAPDHTIRVALDGAEYDITDVKVGTTNGHLFNLPRKGFTLLEADKDEQTQTEEMLGTALKSVMEWIRNWDPSFTDDPEWRETDALVRAALAKLEGK